MDSGKLNRRVLIRKQTDIPAMGAAITQTFDAGISAWANVEPVGNAIFYGTKQVGESTTHRIIVRYQPGVVTDMVITGDHVIDQVINGVTVRYRVKRASDLHDDRTFVLIEVELLGNA
jgi:SPP1 family predicted phage head-tail adaptor